MTFTTARQMFSAEILKLRRNRPLMSFSAVLSIVVVIVYFVYKAIQHSSDPSSYGPAGGVSGFADGLRDLTLYFGALPAILIGTEAGTADLASGVFRDLVGTGRSRLSLFLVRAPAAVAVTLAFTGVAYAVVLAATFAFAGSLPVPGTTAILDGALWLILGNAVVTVLAVGVGSLTGSRAVTLTGVIGWQTVFTQLLIRATSLGQVRAGLISPSLQQLAPIPSDSGVRMATTTAIVVLACWLLIPLALGAWRTRVRDA